MVRTFIAVSVLAIAAGTVAQAADRDYTRGDGIPAGDTVWQWSDMAPQSDAEYLRSVTRNRAMVQEELQTCARRLLADGGIYGRSATLLGAAVAASVSDSRVYLNDSRTVRMVLSDTISPDRAILIQYRRTW
jgi:hypothetical protein